MILPPNGCMAEPGKKIHQERTGHIDQGGKSCMLALLREAIKHLFWTASHVSMGLLSFSHLLCPKWNVYGFVISNFEATKDHGFGTREWLAPQSPALMEQFGGAFTSLGQISN